MLDLLIIGAGPAGITAAYEAKKAGLDYVVIEKGLIGNTIYQYPVGLTVFSTTNELEFEAGGLNPAREKPTREELLSYYVRFVLDNELNVQTEEKVISVCFVSSSSSASSSWIPLGGPKRKSITTDITEEDGKRRRFEVVTDKATYHAKNVLFAMGAMDYPRKLNVPGEDLPKVYDHFRETYPWVKKRALIIGGGNSAGEAALFLAEEGADTTLAIFRGDWENNDPKQGCIKVLGQAAARRRVEKALSETVLSRKGCRDQRREVILEDENGEVDVLPNDVVFVLIGADADLTMLKSLGVKTESGGKYGEVPVYDPETFETNVPGVYVAGHFTSHRHIKGAIDASKALVPKLAERLNGSK
jgi:thioredoxin reductase (NADPH)